MPNLDLKPTNKAVKDYYLGLEEFDRHGVKHEMAVRSAFQRLLEHSCPRAGWTSVEEDMICLAPTCPRKLDLGENPVKKIIIAQE